MWVMITVYVGLALHPAQLGPIDGPFDNLTACEVHLQMIKNRFYHDPADILECRDLVDPDWYQTLDDINKKSFSYGSTPHDFFQSSDRFAHPRSTAEYWNAEDKGGFCRSAGHVQECMQAYKKLFEQHGE